MAEAVYNASGLGLPIVMTVGNRAIGAPINIWNDQSDSLSMRDSGWLQIYAEDNQQALDMHIQAFRIAEQINLPIMVCVDGFILTHAYERIDVPTQEQVDRFLPPFEPRQVLDPTNPISIGAMVGPEAFTEVRYLAHHKQMQALELIPQVNEEFKAIFGRDSGGLVSTYRADDAKTLIVTMGSIVGTMQDVIDELRDDGMKIGLVSLRTYRPFPKKKLRKAVKKAKRVVVFEKALAVGMGGIVASNVRMSMRGLETPVYSVIGGLGGRPITQTSLRELFHRASKDELDELNFLDLQCDVVNRELSREALDKHSGATAENILRDLGNVAAEGGRGGE